MTAPLFQAPVRTKCLSCTAERERAETYRRRMKAADRHVAALLEEIKQLKAQLEAAQ
ncbi:MAG TPA: hypothetical protein VFM12_03155 [Gemmatimonadales bacterium]|nr:hypothetical protein [Gemmatimonadales bacterium]